MKRLTRWLILFGLIVTCLGFLGLTQPMAAETINVKSVTLLVGKAEISDNSNEVICPEFNQKIDLNNANIIAFKDCHGFYPTLASLIIKNSPYQKVEDVLGIPELSDRQKQLLQSQMKNFTLTEPRVSLEMRMPPRPVMR